MPQTMKPSPGVVQVVGPEAGLDPILRWNFGELYSVIRYRTTP